MPADVVHREARGELVVAGVEHHSALVDGPDELGDVVARERVAERGSGHVPAGGVRHLTVLDMEAGPGELLEPADVVVVEVGEDHIGDLVRVHAHGRQRLARRAHETASPAVRVVLAEPGVDDPRRLRGHRHPDEVVHRHRHVVRIAAEEVLRPPRIALRVLHREDAVLAHGAHLAAPPPFPMAVSYGRGEAGTPRRHHHRSPRGDRWMPTSSTSGWRRGPACSARSTSPARCPPPTASTTSSRRSSRSTAGASSGAARSSPTGNAA